MSDATSQLSDCDCCEGVEHETPIDISNVPGASALVYRVGTHSRFKQSMHADLSQALALRALKTRRDDDPAVGVLDAWAMVLDVLSFYQERIANEGFLRTATERRSLLELTNSIGYQLRPGLAASTYLAFMMETTPGTVRELSLKRGAKAQSVPEQGQQAQMFETVEDIVTRGEWNELRPRLTRTQQFAIGGGKLSYASSSSEVRYLYAEGASTGVDVGQLLLVLSGSAALARRVLGVDVLHETTPAGNVARTRIEIEAGSGAVAAPPADPIDTSYDKPVFVPGAPVVPLTQHNIETHVLAKRWRERDLQIFLTVNRWNPDELLQFVAKRRALLASSQGLFALRDRAGFFGSNAPIYGSLQTKDGKPLYSEDWDVNGWEIWDAYQGAADFKKSSGGAFSVAKATVPKEIDIGGLEELGPRKWSSVNGGTADVYLERSVAGVVGGGWTVFTSPGIPESRSAYRIEATQEVSLRAFGMAGKATGLKVLNADGSAPGKPGTLLVRGTMAYVKSEKLALASLPITDDIPAGTTALALDVMTLGLTPGQLVILTGEQADARGVTRSEVLELEEVIHHDGLTTLQFHELSAEEGTQYSYVRATVKLNANIARATHGETRYEVLGAGDATQPFQRFALKQTPLTYVSAPTPSGLASTLDVRVNGVSWDEAPALYARAPGERIFTVRRADDGKSSVQFGDGQTGARLPTGNENITAAYRVGSGLGGMLKAEQISLLLTRPAGLKSVINPVPASGAADPESREQARQNAPLTVMTLDRIVSQQDFEDYVRAYPGIGKARAVSLWDGENKIVHVTVAGADGNPLPASAPLMKTLIKSIAGASAPGCACRVGSFRPLSFNLAAKLLIDAHFSSDEVRKAVSSAVQSAFSFAARAFAESVTKSELLAIMQTVPGVIAVDLDSLHLSSSPVSLESRLGARSADWDEAHAAIRSAELLLVNPREINLSEIAT